MCPDLVVDLSTGSRPEIPIEIDDPMPEVGFASPSPSSVEDKKEEESHVAVTKRVSNDDGATSSMSITALETQARLLLEHSSSPAISSEAFRSMQAAAKSLNGELSVKLGRRCSPQSGCVVVGGLH